MQPVVPSGVSQAETLGMGLIKWGRSLRYLT